jgi:hypothetical protein
MEFNSKDYKIVKTKSYLKKTPLFFFLNTINHDSNDWVISEQNLKNLNLNYYKVFNKLTNNILKNSIYNNTQIVNGITFFIKPSKNSKTLPKQVIVDNFEILLFTLLAIKLNNKIYTITHFKNSNSLEYKENKLALYQFGTLNLKFYCTIR